MQKHEQEPVVSERVMFFVSLMVVGQVLFFGGVPAVEPAVVELLRLSVRETELAYLEWGMIFSAGAVFAGGVVGLSREFLRGEAAFDWEVGE